MRRAVVLAAAIVAVACQGADASAAGLTLDLSGPATLTVGRTTILQATGTVPVTDIQLSYFFSLDAIPTSLMTTCPADRWAALQVAHDGGGSVVVLSQSEHPADAGGAFTIPVAVTPNAPGELLFCAYSDDGETRTLASDSLLVTIRGGAPADDAKAIRAQVVGAIRSCRALLAPGKRGDCLRLAFRRAARRCRALGTRRARTSCLRSVRRLRSTTTP